MQAGLLIEDPDSTENKFRINKALIDPDDIAVIYGTGIGGGSTIADVQQRLSKGKTALPSDILKTLAERGPKIITQAYGIHGAAFAVTDACASSNQAIAAGIKEIMVGDAKIAIVGGTEAAVTPVGYTMFDILPALDREKDPKRASRPLDRSAAGFVMGEGAATLILAREDVARAMGARVLAEF